jgi:hypothetical protein
MAAGGASRTSAFAIIVVAGRVGRPAASSGRSWLLAGCLLALTVTCEIQSAAACFHFFIG